MAYVALKVGKPGATASAKTVLNREDPRVVCLAGEVLKKEMEEGNGNEVDRRKQEQKQERK